MDDKPRLSQVIIWKSHIVKGNVLKPIFFYVCPLLDLVFVYTISSSWSSGNLNSYEMKANSVLFHFEEQANYQPMEEGFRINKKQIFHLYPPPKISFSIRDYVFSISHLPDY